MGYFPGAEGRWQQHILLDATKGRWNFPELKSIAIEQNDIEPDMMLMRERIGQPLADEMRMINLPVVTFIPWKT